MYGTKSKIALFFLVGLFVLLVFTVPAFFTSKRALFVDASKPALSSVAWTGSMAGRAIPFSGYRREIRRLSDRIDLQSQEMLRLRSIEAENERLRSFLFFKRNIPFETIAAQVIGRDPSNWSNSLIIDKGTSSALRANMSVMATKGLVGRIVETGRASSKVVLITDPSSKVGAVLEKSRQGGLIVGRLGGTCRMVYIALDTEIVPGEKVFTAGYGTVFPKGILIGEVTSSGKEAGRLYKYAVVKPAQDLSRVEEVLCIR